MLKRLLLIVALVASVTYFFVRGPSRALHYDPTSPQRRDFPTTYAASKAWLLGQDPYDRNVLENFFPHATTEERWTSGSLNTPAALPLFAALSIFPFRTANLIWTLFNTALMFVLVAVCADLSDVWDETSWTLRFVTFSFALAPVHTDIALGQTALAVTGCIIACVRCDLAHKDRAAGGWLGLALVLKPQMAIAIWLYHAVNRRYRLVLTSVAVFGVSAVIAVIRMLIAGVNWRATYGRNYGAFVTGPGKPSEARGLMLNLDVPLALIVENMLLVRLIVIIIAALGMLSIIYMAWHMRPTPHRTVYIYACLLCLTPLIAYSRFYTATGLIVTAAWTMFMFRRGCVRWAVAATAFMVPFLFPGTAMLDRISASLPADLTSSWLWRGVVVPHETYALLGLFVVMLMSGRAQRFHLDTRNL